MPGDYDGSGQTQPAVFRPSTAQWFVKSAGGGRLAGVYGATNLADIPVPGDYDGVGRTELAFFRPSTAQWFAFGPTGSHALAHSPFGAINLADYPVEGPVGSLAAIALRGSRSGVRAATVPAPFETIRAAAVVSGVAPPPTSATDFILGKKMRPGRLPALPASDRAG